MNIVITGSLGHIGRPLTQFLIDAGHQVTVVSSKQERAEEIYDLEAHPAIGSLDDLDFLTATLQEKDALFAMVPPNFSEKNVVDYYERIAKKYASAIATSSVKRVVYLSSYGAHLSKDTGFILGAHFAENILKDIKNVELTFLRAGYFYYNLFGQIGVIKHQGMMAANYGGDDKIPLVAPEDIAEAAAEELQKTQAEAIRYVVSDERMANEVATVLGKAIDKPELQWKTLTNEEMRQSLSYAFPAHIVEDFVVLGASLHNGRLMEDYVAKGIKPTGKVKLEDFAGSFALAYNK